MFLEIGYHFSSGSSPSRLNSLIHSFFEKFTPQFLLCVKPIKTENETQTTTTPPPSRGHLEIDSSLLNELIKVLFCDYLEGFFFGFNGLNSFKKFFSLSLQQWANVKKPLVINFRRLTRHSSLFFQRARRNPTNHRREELVVTENST